MEGQISKEFLIIEIQKEIYRKSFYEFFKDAVKVLEPGTEWQFNFHHKYICDVLQREAIRIKEKRIRDKHLIINVPFRSSKTLTVAVCFNVWCWMVYEKMSFINLSYSAGLATDASNKVIELINNPWFTKYFAFEMEDSHRAKTDFKLTNGGSRISSGFLGAVLGRGADIIICDDPNSPKDLSEVGRKNTIRTWKDTISTRLNQPEIGLFIIIQQRLHKNDLSGYLLENHPDMWEHICLPAELTEHVKPTELIMKYEDGLLWKERFSRKVLDNFKITLGSVSYSNQLLQEITASEGNIIKTAWFKYITYEEFSELLEINKLTLQSIKWELLIDSAYGVGGDKSGLLISAKINNLVYIRKAFEFNLMFPDFVKKIIEIYKTFNINIIRIEPKANGISIVQQLQRQTNLPVTTTKHKSDDKETCLNAISPLIESGRMVLLEDISNEIVTEQLSKFPNYGKDEMVDLVYYVLNQNIGTGFNYAM